MDKTRAMRLRALSQAANALADAAAQLDGLASSAWGIDAEDGNVVAAKEYAEAALHRLHKAIRRMREK